MANLLVVEDDLKLNDLIKEYLSQYNYKVFQAKNYNETQAILAKEKINLIVLDVMLPEIHGFDICKKIRQTSLIPIIFLSAKGETTDRIAGIEIGADDYINKPFEPRELLARIESILKRYKPVAEEKIITIGDLKIDLEKKNALLKNKVLKLTYLEFEILCLFAKNKGIILNRDFIINELHQTEWDGFNRSIDVLLGRLRKKIKDNKDKPIIKTIWGRGYGIGV